MNNTRRSFTSEFKAEAAALVVNQGYSVAQACTAMGVGETAMRRWVAQLQQEQVGITPQSKALTTEQRRIQELEARVQQLELEKSILKKATALLMA
ncbi:transposase, partial [Andreprevotia lacus]|uniref:transposase n=1 Tax=Andreprevotia lacus TaxID=1121000 RepID=UPI00111C3774